MQSEVQVAYKRYRQFDLKQTTSKYLGLYNFTRFLWLFGLEEILDNFFVQKINWFLGRPGIYCHNVHRESIIWVLGGYSVPGWNKWVLFYLVEEFCSVQFLLVDEWRVLSFYNYFLFNILSGFAHYYNLYGVLIFHTDGTNKLIFYRIWEIDSIIKYFPYHVYFWLTHFYWWFENLSQFFANRELFPIQFPTK